MKTLLWLGASLTSILLISYSQLAATNGTNESKDVVSSVSSPNQNDHDQINHQHEKSSHHKSKHEHKTYTIEEFNRLKTEKIDDLKQMASRIKAEIDAKADLDALQKNEIQMMYDIGVSWIKTIESYRDPKTSLGRSYYMAKTEFDNIAKILSPSKQHDRVQKRIQYLSKDLEDIKNSFEHQASVEDTAFLTHILHAANSYLKFAQENQSHKNFVLWIDKADRFSKIAKKYIKKHRKHLKKNHHLHVKPHDSSDYRQTKQVPNNQIQNDSQSGLKTSDNSVKSTEPQRQNLKTTDVTASNEKKTNA